MNSMIMSTNKIPFHGIVVWSASINLHTDMVYRELSKVVEVIFCVIRTEFRDLGYRSTTGIRVIKIKSVSDLPKETLSNEWLHIGNEVRHRKGFREPLYSCFSKVLKHGCNVMSLNVEQFPWWEGYKGLMRRLQWFWIYNFSPARKIKAIGCQGESGLLAYRKSFVKSVKLFEFIYAPCRIPAAYPPPHTFE